MTRKEMVTDAVAEESARQSVILIFSILGIAVTAIAIRYMNDPAALRLLRMRFLLWARRYAQDEADHWQKVADDLGTRYNAEKE